MKHIICAPINFRLPDLWQWGECRDDGLVTWSVRDPNIEVTTRAVFNPKSIHHGQIRPLGV